MMSARYLVSRNPHPRLSALENLPRTLIVSSYPLNHGAIVSDSAKTRANAAFPPGSPLTFFCRGVRHYAPSWHENELAAIA